MGFNLNTRLREEVGEAPEAQVSLAWYTTSSRSDICYEGSIAATSMQSFGEHNTLLLLRIPLGHGCGLSSPASEVSEEEGFLVR